MMARLSTASCRVVGRAGLSGKETGLQTCRDPRLTLFWAHLPRTGVLCLPTGTYLETIL